MKDTRKRRTKVRMNRRRGLRRSRRGDADKKEAEEGKWSGEEEEEERHLEQLLLAAEAGVGVAVAALPVLLDDEVAALLGNGVGVQLLGDAETRRPELIGPVVPQHDEELQPQGGGGRGKEEKIRDPPSPDTSEIHSGSCPWPTS